MLRCELAEIFCYFWMGLSTLSKHSFLLYDLFVCEAFAEVFQIASFTLHIILGTIDFFSGSSNPVWGFQPHIDFLG